MDILMRRELAFLSLLVSLFLANTATADYSECSAPVAIDPPKSLSTSGEVDKWRNKMDAYLVDIETYLACLATHFEDNKDTLSDDELGAMRNSHSASIAEARQVAENWNRAYASYQKKIAKARN